MPLLVLGSLTVSCKEYVLLCHRQK